MVLPPDGGGPGRHCVDPNALQSSSLRGPSRDAGNPLTRRGVDSDGTTSRVHTNRIVTDYVARTAWRALTTPPPPAEIDGVATLFIRRPTFPQSAHCIDMFAVRRSLAAAVRPRAGWSVGFVDWVLRFGTGPPNLGSGDPPRYRGGLQCRRTKDIRRTPRAGGGHEPRDLSEDAGFYRLNGVGRPRQSRRALQGSKSATTNIAVGSGLTALRI